MTATNRIQSVVFDVGETLIDESRLCLRWAERLGVPPLTFLALIGAGAATTGLGIAYALPLIRPGLDVEAEELAWAADEPDSLRSGFDAEDLYPDVVPTLGALRALGVRTIIAGNQPFAATPALEAMGLPADAIRNSAEMGFEKPDPAFFAAVVEMAGVPPEQIMYVGDRLDNDVRPAAAAGMWPVLIRRGPWGYLDAERLRATSTNAAAEAPVTVIDSLTEIPALLA